MLESDLKRRKLSFLPAKKQACLWSDFIVGASREAAECIIEKHRLVFSRTQNVGPVTKGESL